MSIVTNVLILAGLIEELGETETYPAIDALNLRMDEFDYGHFVEIGQHAVDRKAMERLVFAGAFNGLQDKLFLKYLQEAPWEDRDLVQVLVSRHEQPGFSLFYGRSTRDTWV
jgi:hypothetical protein